MSDSRIKQSNLTLSGLGTTSLKSSLLSSTKSLKTSSLLSTKSTILGVGEKLSSLEINSSLAKKKSDNDGTNEHLEAKKIKVSTSNVLTSEKTLKNSLLSTKPFESSPLLTKTNTLLAKSSLAYDLTNSTSLFSKNSHALQTSSLLKSSILTGSHLVKTTKLEQRENDKIENKVSKRPYFHLDSADGDKQDVSFIHEEYLKTEALIQAINQEQKSQEEEFRKAKRLKNNSINFIDLSLKIKNELTMIQRQKNILINAASSSLLKQPNFKNLNDPTRLLILKYAELVIKVDPEFILKLALYTRRELNIRVTANFLLCLASYKDECRRFLVRYFKESVMLPSDWIEVAEQYQLFMDKKINFGSLPSALRKVMVEKFNDFDEYQLAKYNKEKSRMAKNKMLRDVKHVKSKLKDNEGNEVTGDAAVVEDKFIKDLKNGLKIKDRIYFEMVVSEGCNNVKFDLVFREDKANPSTLVPSRTRRGNVLKKPDQKNEVNESIAVRLNVDYTNRRITQKSFLNKAWSKRSDNVNSPKNFWFYRGFDTVKFYIDVESSEFRFGFIENDKQEFNLSSYAHSKHNIELFKLNVIRISGAGIKLKDLKISSKDAVQLDSQMSEENEQDTKQRSYTLKQLVRQLHIAKPVEHVMALIGKKYPMTFEEFIQTKLPGIFDSDRAGKRMKLATPETWETQISMKGNKASVWEQLIDNKKLPYMAMLRNLRNMIKTGISEKHHQFIIKKLQDEGAVIHSKQFPFRFFTAYEVLDELEQEFDSYLQWSTTGQYQEPIRKNPRQQKNKAKTNKKFSDMNYDKEILKRYKTALDNALKVATTYNISPIKGSTAIFLNLGLSMEFYAGGSAKSLGKKITKISDIAALLSLMFKYSCEHSRLFIFTDTVTYSDIELEQGTILDNMKSLTELKNMKVSSANVSNYPRKAFQEILSQKEHYDNIIYLSNNIADVDYHKSFLRKYRAYVNQNLLFVNVNLSALECSLVQDQNFDHDNDVNIAGYSDSILRFVAERGNQGQLVHIENIEKSYELPVIKHLANSGANPEEIAVLNAKIVNAVDRPKFKIFVPTLKWKSVKVFVSSTFRDMHSERDLLSRTVFPMLRSKLSSRLITVTEIDMRWGITETETKNNQTLDLCLTQILESDYFIGLLGERYGLVLNEYLVRNRPELNWVASYSPGASITELEIECQIRKTKFDEKKYEKSFFYLRDGEFLKTVPEAYRNHFLDENEELAVKLAKLKSRIRSEPFEIFDGYKCKWLKLEDSSDGRALLCDLDVFAHRVFNNLFNAISNHNKLNDVELNECVHQTNLNNAYIKLHSDNSVARTKLSESLEKLLIDNKFIDILKTTTDASKEIINKQNSLTSMVLITGEAGCGKTAFLSFFLTEYLANRSSLLIQKFVHMVGSYENSDHITLFLKRLCYNVAYEYSLEKEFNLDEIINSNDYNYFKDLFSKILKSLSTKITEEKFYIIIDGVDFLVDDNNNLDLSFSWLPNSIPNRIGFIFTARSSSPIKSILNKIVQREENKLKLNLFDIESLSILEKGDVIRNQLNMFNKSLDETPFNNQMKLLSGKKDAVNPLYLKFACEELRLHNQFETLNSKIKELPIKINLMIDYALKRLENNFGDTFTNAAFMFIICSRDGLLEQELKELMQIYFAIDKNNFYDLIESCDSFMKLDKNLLTSSILKNKLHNEVSTLKVFSFVDSISQTFLKPISKDGESILSIKSSELIESSLRSKYSNKTFAKEKRINYEFINKIMALYYWHCIDNKFECKWEIPDQRAFIYLPYHLSVSNSYNDLALLLCDLQFLAAKCDLKLAFSLMDDFDLHESSKSKNILANSTSLAKSSYFSNKTPASNSKLNISILNSKRFLDYKLFMLSNYHLFYESPTLIYQQAMNQPEYSHPSIDLKKLLEKDCDVNYGFLFEWINKAKDTDKFGLSPVQISDINEPISTVCLSPNGQKIACGTKNCEIKLYNSNTAALIRNFQGHSGRINQLCFAGEEILCSASSDGIASIWNVNEGFRIKVLNKHNNHVVSSCCAEPNGKSIITVGWDCTAKIWSINGDLQGELKGHPRPINSVVFSPDGFSVATACWDSCIRIYNLFDRSRKAILRGHKNSIRSISYSSNGVYIASASLDGEVKLWNSKNGSQLATLSNSMPVNSLCFSPENQFLITGSSDRRTKVWSGTVGKMIKVITEEKPQPITACCFNQNTGDTFAVGYHDGNIKIFELYGGIAKGEIKAHNTFIKRLKFSTSKNYLITAADDGSSKVIDVSSMENMKVVAELIGNTKSINGIDINKNNTIITGSENCLLSIYPSVLDSFNLYNQNDDEYMIDDSEDSNKSTTVIKQSPKITLDDHKSPVTACTFNSEGDKFASSAKNATIIIWSFNNINSNVIQLLTINNAHSDWITDLKWSNSSDFILSSSNDYSLKIWNANDGKEKSKLTGHTANINSCSFQYGCGVSTCFDGTVNVWSHKGHLITTLSGHQKRVNCCDLFIKIKNKLQVNKVENKDDANEDDEMNGKLGNLWGDMVEEENWVSKHKKAVLNKKDVEVEKVYLVTVSDDSTIRIWKPVESDYLISLENHNDIINSVSLSKNNIIATASEDRTANLWNMNEFFKNYQSGLHINAERVIKNHNSEIVCICVNTLGTYILSGSRDGVVIIWKCKFNDSKFCGIEFVYELQAHDRQVNSICVLDEKNTNSLMFATCSDDKSIKLWSFIENQEKIANRIDIELFKTVNSQNQVLYINKVKKMDNHLISVESDSTNILVRFYKVNKKSIQVIQAGCSLTGTSFVTNQIKLTADYLYITLMQNEILKFNLNDISKKFQPYSFYNKEKFNQLILSSNDPKSPIDISLQGSKMNWFSCITEESNIMAGDNSGNLYNNDSSLLKLEMKKTIHSARISELLNFKTDRDSDRLITASQDGSIKIWTKNAENQLGQFNSNSGITVLTKLPSSNAGYHNFIFGDQMGNLNLLRWYDDI